jgi:hypothetical protein
MNHLVDATDARGAIRRIKAFASLETGPPRLRLWSSLSGRAPLGAQAGNPAARHSVQIRGRGKERVRPGMTVLVGFSRFCPQNPACFV